MFDVISVTVNAVRAQKFKHTNFISRNKPDVARHIVLRIPPHNHLW